LKEATLKAGLNIAKRESISLSDEKEAAEKAQKKEEAEEKELFIKDIKSGHEEKKVDSPIEKKPELPGLKIIGKLDPSELSVQKPPQEPSAAPLNNPRQGKSKKNLR
jgi:hypothetical protein